MTAWAIVITAAVACYALKAAGYVLPARAFEPPPVRRTSELLPVALLAGLVATQTFAVGQALQLDARVPALGVAIVLLMLRAPFLVVVLAAAAAAALVRLLF